MENSKLGAAKPPRAGGGVSSTGFEARQAGRKPLFGTGPKQTTTAPETNKTPALTRSKTSPSGMHGANKESAAGLASPALATPGGSRIPRFGSGGFGSRKPLSLTEAYRLAGEEEQENSARHGPIDGSPSPAPRSWRMRPGAHQLDAEAKAAGGTVSPNKERIAMRNRVDDGIGKSRTSRWVLEEGMRDSIGQAADVPLPSTENVPPASGDSASPEKSYAWQVDEDFTAGDLQVSDSPRIRVNYNHSKPPVSKAARASNSPLKKGSTANAKLEEIRTRELGLAPNQQQSPRFKSSTKLDDIKLREQEAEKQIPLLERGFPRTGSSGNTKLDDIRKLEAQGLSKRAIAAAKLEEIKERNAMTRSISPDEPKRAWAGRDGVSSGIPRSKSAFESVGRPVPDTPVTIYKSKAEMIADDVRRAAAKRAQESKDGDSNKDAVSSTSSTSTNSRNRGAANGLSPQRRDQSRDLLRRLARAASSSPAAPERRQVEKEIGSGSGSGSGSGITSASNGIVSSKPAAPRASSMKRTSLLDNNGSRRTSNTSSSNASKNTASSDNKPTVGFAGLAAPRSESADSRKSKRSSLHSEQDPTDRIEAEERLFAPLDNYSERGSVRAPSPYVDADDDDEDEGEDERKEYDATTPKATNKQDFLSMPTPRAPGAYVETPATVKKEDRVAAGLDLDVRPSGRRRRASLESGSGDIKTLQPATLFRDEKPTSFAWRSKDLDTASDPGTGEDAGRGMTTDKQRPAPRARSLPRRRPLKNSAKPPSVRDDLRELQRIHDIDDNTLDNLEDILLGKKSTSEKLDALLREIPAAAAAPEDVLLDEVKCESPPPLPPPRPSSIDEERLDDELAKYERLSESVERDILGATKNKPTKATKATKATTKPSPPATNAAAETTTKQAHQHTHDHQDTEQCPRCVAKPSTRTIAYLHLPLPRLFYRSPHPRPTLLGLVFCLLSLWYAAETTMCRLYCRPSSCAAGSTPCVWSFDDPSGFGTALPVKLDQWATGGRGRAALESVGDWAADVLDELRGVGVQDGDAKGMTFAQRKRLRRRMARRKGSGSVGGDWTAEQKAKVQAWRKDMMARERAAKRGHVEEESVGADERVWM